MLGTLENDEVVDSCPCTRTRAVLPRGRVADYLHATTGDGLSVRRLVVPTRTPDNQRNLLTE